MDKKENLFVKIDVAVKNRARQHIVNSKVTSQEKTDSMQKLVEVALDYYISNNPIQV